MSDARPVSQILLEDHHITLRVGAKGECPFCNHTTFSIKPGDILGKCFHPACGRLLTQRQAGPFKHSLSTVLERVAAECHQELLRQTSLGANQKNAYTYLHDERRIHPQVIAEAMVGAVPAQYAVRPYFQDVIDEVQKALDAMDASSRGRMSKKDREAKERLEKRLDQLKNDQGTLGALLEKYVGWIVFVYSDAAHRPVALRLREPYAKRFVSFKPGIAGVFGHELFTPYKAQAYQHRNHDMIIVEGELNVLQLQTLACRYGEAIKEPPQYVLACAVGSVTIADVRTIMRLAPHPVVCYDHDAHEAGFELVKRLQKATVVEAFTTPGLNSDLDSFIDGMMPHAVRAWHEVKHLVDHRKAYGRIYTMTGEEFFDYTITSTKSLAFIPKLLGEALMGRETYRYTASLLWVYRDGVYRSNGEAVLLADAQKLLGAERHDHRLDEALHFVEVATRLEGDVTPDRQYLNLLNGRLDVQTRDLVGHTPRVFTIVQLPVAYDAGARCPEFDNYLRTTFDLDVIPLIHEILGWCLLPDTRFETAVMLIGEGENGKSVFLDLLGYVLGEENTSNVALQDLEENRFKAAQLYGKLANIFADLDARGLQSSSMFKTLVTGDPIDAERKHRDPFSFRSYAKLLFSANKMPSSRDKSYAFYRRWLMIPFTRTFDGVGTNPKPDKELRAKLKTELAGILNHALDGLARLNASETFTKPKSVVEAKQAYITSNDNVRAFVSECVLAEQDGTIVKRTFYEVYERWCDAYGERAVSQKALKESLQKIIPNLDEYRARANDPWSWLGMDWADDAKKYL